MASAYCPVCGHDEHVPLVDVEGMPVYCNVLWARREEALATPRGDIRLSFCGRCGMIWNRAFDPDLLAYGVDYENSLHFSEVFNEYARGLAERLIARHGLEGKDVLEIGCGKGEFLTLLCAGGRNRGIGLDPSYEPGADPETANGGVRFVRDVFREEHASLPADLVCCRHVLEHVEDPRAFVRTLGRALAGREGTAVYFEVPAAEYLLSNLAVWDVIYEHPSVFSAPALRRLFRDGGFDVLDGGFSFGGQYLWIEATPRQGTRRGEPDDDPEVASVARHASAFERRFHAKIEAAGRRLDERPGAVALWGAGSKGVTFLNLADRKRRVSAVVDINPRKHGRHVAGSGQAVLPPEQLLDQAPQAVIVMNPLYRGEIATRLHSIGLAADLLDA